ncbi:MAG: diguanylate cyclase domain-containing protein, partial [Mycobacterium sp.]
YLGQREQKLLIEKERASRERAEAEARYRILAENLVDVVVLLNASTIFHLHGTEVVWVSPSVQTAFGDAPPQWIGSDFSSRIHPDDIDRVEAAQSEIAPGGSVISRFRVRAADGNYHWVDGHCKPYVDAAGDIDGMLMALRLVDELVEAERLLQRLARFDTLTGLVNRGETIARLQTALVDSRDPGPHVGVLFCDVDKFKAINDTYGHAAGDVILTTMADRIRSCVRDGDIVGRTGGDEMLVLLPNIHNIDEVADIAETIRGCAAEPIRHDGQTIHATLSIGATISTPGESADSITARADTAMYQAKQSGRNSVAHISR